MKKSKLLFNNLLRRYHRYQRKLNRLIEGEFSNFSMRTAGLDKRIAGLRSKLESIGDKLTMLNKLITKTAAAGMLVAGLMAASSTNVEAQVPNVLFDAPQVEPFGLAANYNFYYSAPDFVDIDADGDFDLFVGEISGGLGYFENTGNNLAPAFAAGVQTPFGISNFNTIKTSGLVTPSFVDIDNDGDQDLFFGDYFDTNIRFNENTGTANNPAFAGLVFNPFGIASPTYAMVLMTFADIDDDGDLGLAQN